MKITSEDAPAPSDFEVLHRGLKEFNESKAGASNYKPLAIFLRDSEDHVVGGLNGSTGRDWLEIDCLWVSEVVRGQGYGTKLIQTAEKEAIARGCRHAFLDTFSFQALDFYKKLGYVVFGTLEDFPQGHSRYFLKKTILQVTTRPACAADMEFVRAVHHQAYRDVVQQQSERWDEKEQDRHFAESWASITFEIVLRDGIPCGYTCIEDRQNDIHVRELVILPEFQNQGVGSSLLRTAMERARARRVPVRLGTFHVNRAANLYRRLGFQETGRTDIHILFEWNSSQG